MITQQQLEELARDYQIDQLTVFRGYLQLLFLNYLYQQRQANRIYFKGGTAIHLFLNSPRFSEDLDFGTEYDKKRIREIISKVEKEMERELPGVKILLLYQAEKSIRFRLKYSSTDFKYPFVIRLDFTEKEKPGKVLTSPVVTEFPIGFFPIVLHYPPEEILAEKIRAFLTRAKGRDIFDLWFLLEKKVRLDAGLVEKKLKEAGKRFDRKKMIGKIREFPLKKLELDLNKFLPRPQRKIIKVLKERLIKQIQSVNNME